MGWFTTNKYSTQEHQLSAEQIKFLVSQVKVRSLDSSEETLVEDAIIARRKGDGKISLQQIYEVLLKLNNQNKISKYDKDGLMRMFEEYFIEHFDK